MTDSGYPKSYREWQRGTALSSAPVVYSGEKGDVCVSGSWYYDRGFTYEMINRAVTFYTSEDFLRIDGEVKKVDVPEDTDVGTFGDQFLITLRKPWKVNGTEYPSGALLSSPVESLLAGDTSKLLPMFIPTSRTSLDSNCGTKDYLILIVLDNVQTKLVFWKYDSATKTWTDEKRTWTDPDLGMVQVWGISPDDSNDVWVIRTGYTTPTTLYLTNADDTFADLSMIKQLKSQFNADGLEVTQSEATSKDGTKIPYFMIAKKGMALDGSHPTILYGYGGFEISLLPYYSATTGVGWLEKGGVYVSANIRGGGEFGPEWHQAALKEKRHKAYEDFIAVGEQLIERGITSSPRLAVEGGSNGGLLVGNMLHMAPKLWGAIVCQVPLLDMKRFNKLLAGASWMGEYGDPDKPEEWESLKAYSPYHNIQPGTAYPSTLFTTSTRDDRVHPGHARKMVARLAEMNVPGIYYFENIEGGHGGAADNKQRAYVQTLTFQFLWNTIGGDRPSL